MAIVNDNNVVVKQYYKVNDRDGFTMERTDLSLKKDTKCARCGKKFSQDEHDLCLMCTHALENEMLGRIKSRLYQIEDTIDSNTGKIYVCRRDVLNIIDNCKHVTPKAEMININYFV